MKPSKGTGDIVMCLVNVCIFNFYTKNNYIYDFKCCHLFLVDINQLLA